MISGPGPRFLTGTPIAFVLSGGTSLGAVQVGMLRALAELGVQPDLLVGSSVGAINAAYIGQGFTVERVDRLAAIWRRLRTRDVFGRLGMASFVRALLGRQSLASASRLRVLLAKHLPSRHEQLLIPTTVIGADAASGKLVELDEGDLRTNVLASAAIPGVFPPVVVDGRLLVDGGVAANVPLLPAAGAGAMTLVVLDAGFPCDIKTPPRGVVATWLHTVSAILRHQSLGVLPFLAERHAVIYIPAPCPMDVLPHDFSQGGDLIDRSYSLACDYLEDLVIETAGIYGHPHIHHPRQPRNEELAKLASA